MLRIILLILLLLPTTSNADQGLKISCLNMKYVVIGRKHDPLKFTMQAVGLEYLISKNERPSEKRRARKVEKR